MSKNISLQDLELGNVEDIKDVEEIEESGWPESDFGSVAELLDYSIDESYPSVVIAGITFSPSDILKKLDPVAYNIMLREFEQGKS